MKNLRFKSQKMTIKELGFSMIDNYRLKPVFLKRVTTHESRIIDSYREVNKDQEVDFIKEMMEDQDVYNVIQNGSEILVYK